MTGKELWELIQEKENGCDHKCETCGLFLKDKNYCLFEIEKKRQAWANKQREERMKND